MLPVISFIDCMYFAKLTVKIDYDAATKEFVKLLQTLEDTGLHVEVRPGYEQSILLFVKAPIELLGNRVYKLRYEYLHTYI
jgi:hypothetical protein